MSNTDWLKLLRDKWIERQKMNPEQRSPYYEGFRDGLNYAIQDIEKTMKQTEQTP